MYYKKKTYMYETIIFFISSRMRLDVKAFDKWQNYFICKILMHTNCTQCARNVNNGLGGSWGVGMDRV